MNILTKYTSRDYLRNGKLNIQGGNVTSTTSYGGGGGISISGNYLPATQNADGTYTVDLTQVTFNGNILSTGEITAYGVGSSSGTTGTSTSGSVTIYDGLDSDSALIALSANQGRVLKNLIDTMGSGGTSINIIIDEDSLADNQILVYNATTKQWENKANEGISEISKLKDVSLSNVVDKNILQYNATTSKWENKPMDLSSSALTQHLEDTVKHITAAERTNWNNKLDKSVWDKAFYFDSNGNLRVKLNLIGDAEISAYGSGTSTASGAITIVDSLNSTLTDAALSANQGRVLKSLIDSANMGNFDLSDYSKTSHTHSNYSTTSHTHTDYSKTGHTHSYTSTVKLGTTSYNVSDNTISLPAYPTLSTLGAASSTDLNNHTANTTAHITATERTNWNAAYNNNHTHSNKSVLDGITSTKVSNWDKVYKDWNDVFTIDSNGNLKVKVNLIGEKEVSAYGSGTSTSSGAITIVDNLTSTLTDAALSANQGRVLKSLIDSANFGDFDLSGYSKTSHTHSNYSVTSHTHSNYSVTSHTHSNYSTTGHTHSIANITNLQSSLDGKSGTGHTHSAYSPTSHTHSNYSVTSHTHSAYATTGTVNTHTADTTVHITAAERTAWNAKSDAHSHPYASSSHTHTIANITNLQSSLDGKSGTGHTHNYAGSSSAGGAATSANKVNSTLTFTGGTFASKTFNGSAATTVNIPTHTSHITNNSGFITTAATVANANYATSAGSASNATTASKLSTVSKTAWGQTFWTSGGIPTSITGNITGSYFKINDTSSNPYLQLTQGSTWYIQGYNNYLYLGAGSTKSLRVDATGNCLSVGEVTAHSDKRLKDNIQPLTNRGYITPTTYIKDGKESIGFIAQDMQLLYPELVTVDESTEEKYLTVNYMQYTAVLQAQIIELSKEIQELKDKLNDIYNKDK